MDRSDRHLRCASASRPASRATARLALCTLLAAFTASPLHAQWDRERRLVINAGVGAGLPLSLYDGRIDIDRSPILEFDPRPLASGVTLQYREELAQPMMAWAELAYDPGTRHWLALRGSFGRSASRATYTGGHAPPESFDRRASWWDVSLLGRVTIVETGSSRLYLQGGPSLTHWHLDLAGVGRDAIAEFAVASRRAAEPAATPALAGVEALLAAGDTAAAIAELERLAATGPEDAAVLGTLGLLVAQTAPTRETEFQQRQRARALLERALQLDPGNPRYLLGIGNVLERAGLWLDAQRVLTRALSAAARRPDAISPAELADLFYRRGRSLEMRVIEFENLRMASSDRLPVNAPECSAGDAFCLNWARPRIFFEMFQDLPDISNVIAERRSALVREYTRAIELVPDHDGANRGLLALHARAGDWPAFVEQARRWVEAAPGDPWAALFLAAGLHWTGNDDEAETLIARTLPALDPADRRGGNPRPRAGRGPCGRHDRPRAVPDSARRAGALRAPGRARGRCRPDRARRQLPGHATARHLRLRAGGRDAGPRGRRLQPRQGRRRRLLGQPRRVVRPAPCGRRPLDRRRTRFASRPRVHAPPLPRRPSGRPARRDLRDLRPARRRGRRGPLPGDRG